MLIHPLQRPKRLSLGMLAAAVAALGGCLVITAETHRFAFRAADAFEQGQGAWGVQKGAEGTVELYDRVLVEDDGPGIGGDADWLVNNRAPTTEITGEIRVKKILHLDRPAVKAAYLYVPLGVTVEINGRALPIPDPTQYPEVPPNFLRAGDNEIVLRGADRHATIKIALPEDILRNAPERAGQAKRSFVSRDGGKNWQAIRGEYMVRLQLVQFVPSGRFVSKVIDLGQPQGDDLTLLTPVKISSVMVEALGDTPAGTRLECAVRTGRSPVYDAASWSNWQPAGSRTPPEHRYLQWQITLLTDDPLQTPAVRTVNVTAEVSRSPIPAWASSLKVGAVRNEEIRSTSIPFQYEDPLNPKLVELRKNYRLDEVVAGAQSETEQFVKLRDWVAHQWKYKPPEDYYPPWDANEILSHKCGFCVQYAIVLMQCAISMGHQARFVFGYNPGAFDGGGHEVCEIWSNEYRKWVFMDVNQDWHYLDAHTKTPMSMLEVHNLILKTYYSERPAIPENAPQSRLPSDALGICYGTSMIPSSPPPDMARHWTNGLYTVPTRWLFINYMPRNNFLAAPYPQPKTQGVHWDWPDYWCWEDARMPKRRIYRNFTARTNDLNWSLNQVRFDATLGTRPNEVAVQMATFTPYFETFLVRAESQPWKASPPALTWQLHPGRNRLEMHVRNRAGVEGPVSFLELERP